MFEMKEEYYTGIQLVDDEHTKLLGIAESAYQLLNDHFVADKYDQIKVILQELKDYTKTHFADEEAYMERIQYKRMFTQKIQHQHFIEKLEEINMDEVDEDHNAAIQDLLDFLMDWLIHHIVEMDKLIGQD